MRFSIIERNPESYTDVRRNLETLWNAVMANETNELSPLSEIRENENEYIIKLQLPGVEKQDINIEIEDRILTVSAELKQEDLQENETMHYSNIRYGKIEKTLEFEKEIDNEDSRCEFNNGILKITLKKMMERKNTTKLNIE